MFCRYISTQWTPSKHEAPPNVGPMLGHRLRRWPNIGPTLGRCLVFAGLLPKLCRFSIRVWPRQMDKCENFVINLFCKMKIVECLFVQIVDRASTCVVDARIPKWYTIEVRMLFTGCDMKLPYVNTRNDYWHYYWTIIYVRWRFIMNQHKYVLMLQSISQRLVISA